MADIYKTKEIETNINERGVNLGNVDVTLYTMDKGSAAFKIYLKREVDYANEKVYDPVNLYTTDMTPRIDVVAADGSVFSNEPVDIVIPENGVIQYIVSDYVIRHAGKMDVYIYLENKSESVQVANFYFYIEEDGVARRLGKEITGGRLEDVVKNVMSGQLMELLSEDFREQLEREIKTFLQDHNKDFNLRFEDLTREEKDELMKNLTNQGLADFRIEDNSIFNEKLVDGTIQPGKTDFFTKNTSRNLLVLSTLQKNKSIDTAGNIIDAPNYWLTDLIPVDSLKSEQINVSNDGTNAYRIALYDENKKFLGRPGILNESKYTPAASSLTKYVRISGTRDINTVMINKGPVLLPYEAPTLNATDYKLKPELYDKTIPDGAVTTSKIGDKSVTVEKTSFLKTSTGNNLLNLETVLRGKTIETDGTIVDDEGRWLTDLIPVDSSKNEQINISNDGTNSYRIALYDKDKKFISRMGVTGDTKFVPNPSTQAMYVRISGVRDLNDTMINKGPTSLPLEKYVGEVTKMNTDIKVTPDNEVHFQKSSNLFNKNTIQVNKTLDINGNIVEDNKYVLSAPIKAKGKKIAMTTDNSVRWGIYTKDGISLGRGGKTQGSTDIIDLTKSPNAEYVLLSIVKTNSDGFMVNYGENVLSYEKFGYKLVSTNEYPITIANDIVPAGVTSGNTGNTTTQVVSGNVIDLKGTSQIYRDISSSFNPKDTTEVYSTNAKSQIDYIEFSTNNINAELILTYVDDKGTNKTSTITNPSDNSELPLTLDNIVNYGYPNTDFIVYDPTKAIYKIAIKDLKFSNGFKLVAKNSGSINANIGVKLVGRYYV